MMNHIKRLWGHYLTLVILNAALAVPIYLIYRFFLNSFGNEAALLSLTITVMIVAILGIQGALHTHRIIQGLGRKINNTKDPEEAAKINPPFVLKILKIEKAHSQSPVSESRKSSEEADLAPSPLISFSRKHRGKRPLFPEDQIRKAVLRWENRDRSFSARTLEEFLAQEFGSSPDGILLMASSTFYDWRRRIRKELEEQKRKS
jgi:hypothetical protein